MTLFFLPNNNSLVIKKEAIIILMNIISLPYDQIKINIAIRKEYNKPIILVINYKNNIKKLIKKYDQLLSIDYAPVFYQVKGRGKNIDINQVIKDVNEVLNYIKQHFNQKIILLGTDYNFIIASLIAKTNKDVNALIAVDPIIDNKMQKEEGYSFLYDYLSKSGNKDLTKILSLKPFPDDCYHKKGQKKEKTYNYLIKKHFLDYSNIQLLFDKFKNNNYQYLDQFFYNFSFFDWGVDFDCEIYFIIPSQFFHHASICYFNQIKAKNKQIYYIEEKQINSADQKVEYAFQSIALHINCFQ